MSKDNNTTTAAALSGLEAFEAKYRDEIAARINAGLTRDQAVNVIRAQAEHDAALEAAKKTNGKA